jgi:hypothetical protein
MAWVLCYWLKEGVCTMKIYFSPCYHDLILMCTISPKTFYEFLTDHLPHSPSFDHLISVSWTVLLSTCLLLPFSVIRFLFLNTFRYIFFPSNDRPNFTHIAYTHTHAHPHILIYSHTHRECTYTRTHSNKHSRPHSHASTHTLPHITHSYKLVLKKQTHINSHTPSSNTPSCLQSRTHSHSYSHTNKIIRKIIIFNILIVTTCFWSFSDYVLIFTVMVRGILLNTH